MEVGNYFFLCMQVFEQVVLRCNGIQAAPEFLWLTIRQLHNETRKIAIKKLYMYTVMPANVSFCFYFRTKGKASACEPYK